MIIDILSVLLKEGLHCLSNSISYRLPSNNSSVERIAMRLKRKKPPTIIVALTFHWKCVNQSHKSVRNGNFSETLFGTKQTTTTSTTIPQYCDETFYLSKSHDVRNVVCYYSRITIKFILFYSILFGDVFFFSILSLSLLTSRKLYQMFGRLSCLIKSNHAKLM